MVCRCHLAVGSVDMEIFAALAIALHESPGCTTAIVVQSWPSSPKQRSCAGLPSAGNTKLEESRQACKLYLS